MSTPFPVEEQADQDSVNSAPLSNPWNGPTKPGFFSGLGYNEDNDYLGPSAPILSGIGSAVSKVVGGVAGAASSLYGAEASIGDDLARGVGLHPGKNPLQAMADELSATQAAAQRNVDALSPNPATTGTAFQIVHGLSEGASLAAAGAATGGTAGAVGLTAATEGAGTYEEQKKAGVRPGVAAVEGGISAIASGAGVLIPGGFGSTLATRLLTGAASNVGLGVASRYADHKILETAGYPEMAAQQKVWDSTQVLTDALLGVAFGGIAHLHGAEETAVKQAANEPGMQDAALVSNLAVRDRASAPGVPADPAASNAHQAALNAATGQLLRGEPVDVSQTGVADAKFLARPVDEQQRLAEVHASILEQLSQQRDQLISDSAPFLRGNDVRAASRELDQHQTTRDTAQAAFEAIPEPKAAADLKPDILARMEAEDKESYGEDWNTKQYTKLREKAATKEARETADQQQQDFMQAKSDAQGQVDNADELVSRQSNIVDHLTRAEESFKALRSHDAAVAKAGDDPAELAKVIGDEQNRRALQDQLNPIEPTEENLAQHIAKNPDAAVGGYLNTDTGQVHLDDNQETRPFRLPAENEREADGEGNRPDAEAENGAARSAAAGEAGSVRNNQGGKPATESGGPGSGRGAGESGLDATVHAALEERPKLEVAGDDGKPVSAADLLAQATQEAHAEMADFQKAVTAAIQCFGRRGA